MEYTEIFTGQCPVDASKVTHTVTFTQSTDPCFDDTVEEFKCSRDSKCVKCSVNYR